MKKQRKELPQTQSLANLRKEGAMLRKSILVCFLGIDGSGKTSNALQLGMLLSNAGIPCSYARRDDLLTRSVPASVILWASNFLAKSRKKIGSLGIKTERATSSVHATTKAVWFLALEVVLVYAWIAYLLTIKSRSNGQTILCDRYFYDWAFLLGGGYSDALVRLIPRPDLVFVLDLPLTEAYSRMRSEKDKEFPVAYYSSLRNWYLSLAKKNGFKVVNSGSGFTETSNEILSHVMALLKGEFT